MEALAKDREALASKTHGKEALDHIITAAELYFKAAQEASSPEEKKRLMKKCQALTSQAEASKKSNRPRGSVVATEQRLMLPRQTRDIPKSEQAILLRGSRLHGNVFPPWESDPGADEFNGDLFYDKSHLSLSQRQIDVFSGWKRPQEIMIDRGFLPNSNEQSDDDLMKAQQECDFVQDITTDCSVVASLCASIRLLGPGPKSILPALMFPIDPENGQPKTSANGKYVFRMFFNGCFRKVVIDDRLPTSSINRTFYVVDRQNPKLIWPALIEKAYLKVRGGYDFPGSNSSTDLFTLTGWIPQQLFLQSDEMDWDSVWERVKKAYDYGDVVVTVGTGRLSTDEEETLGLAGEHDYAVLDMFEEPGSRKLLVKNPWCDGLAWKGVASSEVLSSRTASHHSAVLKPGSFWISYDDVAQHFESLYLNWNPSLFTKRQDHHFNWEIPDSSMAESFAHNPQYSMSADAEGHIWIILSRHWQDRELDILRSQRTTSTTNTLAEVSSKLGFMSIYVFTNANGKRVQLSSQPLFRGNFVDSPQTLAPLEAAPGVKYTIVVAAQELPLPKYTLTLSFFSRANLTVAPAEPALKYYTELKSSWTRRTAGGNSDSATYLQNPQFSITLSRASPLSLLISTAKEDLYVHVDLVWARGDRVTALGNRDVLATSGDYRRGCALAESPLVDPGTYTAVCSTFDPGCLADFTLRVGSDIPCTITPIAAYAAGRLRTKLPDLAFRPSTSTSTATSITASISAMSLNDTETNVEVHKKKRIAVFVDRLTRASVVITRSRWSNTIDSTPSSRGGSGSGISTPRSYPTVRATLEYGTGPDKFILASTDGGDTIRGDGNYSNSNSNSSNNNNSSGEFREVGVNGLRTPDFDINPAATARLWLVVEQLGLSYHSVATADPALDALHVDILSDAPVHTGAWETVDD
ncbi:cysteine proteinase [Hypoxylon fragiforme]|uniref:cysteine proteinase n=1 Tax=Hypoxylon fragiforme TaxID=63214 RepID=UPI0020C678AF|nr:cysteine proteinase [Hypoxylon fragiforme]KAI2612428.1 cysteine proteinase [Hypoxylon fragiforme]